MSSQYSYRIEWSDEDQTYVGRCTEFPSLAAHGPTAESALAEIQVVVEESVQWMLDEGEPVPKAIGTSNYRGNILFRTTPEIHRELSLRAQESGVSLNLLLYGLVERNLSVLSLDHDMRAVSDMLVEIRRQTEDLEAMLQRSLYAHRPGLQSDIIDTNNDSRVLPFDHGPLGSGPNEDSNEAAIAEG